MSKERQRFKELPAPFFRSQVQSICSSCVELISQNAKELQELFGDVLQKVESGSKERVEKRGERGKGRTE